MSAPNARSGRVESESSSFLIRSAKSPESANDSYEQRKGSEEAQDRARRYLTRARVEAAARAMNKRQMYLLKDIDRLGVATASQLQQLHYESTAGGKRLARKELAQLSAWGVVTRLERSIGGKRAGSSGHVYGLGPAGQRLLRPNQKRYRAAWTPQPAYLAHALAVTDLYVRLKHAEATTGVTLMSFDTEPRCWRPFVGAGGARTTLKPDASLVVGIDEFEDSYFVEIDRGTEPSTRITDKARTYIRYRQTGKQEELGVFPYILWVVPNERRARLLVSSLAKLPAEHWALFLVATTEDAIKRIMTGMNSQTEKERR